MGTLSLLCFVYNTQTPHSLFFFCKLNMLLTLSRANLRRSTITTTKLMPSVLYRRTYATDSTDTQNLIEKIVQKYALDLPEGYKVKSGDYVTIRPHHVLTHDNTGAVIPK